MNTLNRLIHCINFSFVFLLSIPATLNAMEAVRTEIDTATLHAIAAQVETGELDVETLSPRTHKAVIAELFAREEKDKENDAQLSAITARVVAGDLDIETLTPRTHAAVIALLTLKARDDERDAKLAHNAANKVSASPADPKGAPVAGNRGASCVEQQVRKALQDESYSGFANTMNALAHSQIAQGTGSGARNIGSHFDEVANKAHAAREQAQRLLDQHREEKMRQIEAFNAARAATMQCEHKAAIESAREYARTVIENLYRELPAAIRIRLQPVMRHTLKVLMNSSWLSEALAAVSHIEPARARELIDAISRELDDRQQLDVCFYRLLTLFPSHLKIQLIECMCFVLEHQEVYLASIISKIGGEVSDNLYTTMQRLQLPAYFDQILKQANHNAPNGIDVIINELRKSVRHFCESALELARKEHQTWLKEQNALVQNLQGQLKNRGDTESNRIACQQLISGIQAKIDEAEAALQTNPFIEWANQVSIADGMKIFLNPCLEFIEHLFPISENDATLLIIKIFTHLLRINLDEPTILKAINTEMADHSHPLLLNAHGLNETMHLLVNPGEFALDRFLDLNPEIAQKFKRIAARMLNLQIAQLREQLSSLNM